MKRIFVACAASVLTAFGSLAGSPYISRVLEYKPAPGQFVNTMPEIESTDTPDQVCAKVLEQIGLAQRPGMISLGAYGGYVVFGFDHPVVNVRDAFDFKIYGNAFASGQNATDGSSEPGIVMVSRDANGNGQADDQWYELAGSEYADETTLKHYKITYYKPTADHVAVPDPECRQVIDAQYIRWTASDGTTGYVTRNQYHAQSYWPEWIRGDRLEFEGTRLAPNGYDASGNGAYYAFRMLDWGYADNRPNDDAAYKGFDIGWAVDADGNKVNLPQIDFIKVYTAVNQTNGWVGETSTEICGAEDLHPDATGEGGIDVISTNADVADSTSVYDLYGRRVAVPQRGTVYLRAGRKFIMR